MSKAANLVDALKRELKARGITYAQLAQKIGMSEASIKRMFAQKNFTLARLDEILQACDIEFSELAHHDLEPTSPLISQLTQAQEKEIISDPKLMLVALSCLNQISMEAMLASYQMTEVEIIKHLLKLDKIGFLQLLPNNRVKLLVSRTFRWLPHGPIQSYFLGMVENDFLASRFDGDGEWMQLINVMLSRSSILQLQNRLKQVAKEVAALHQIDANLPFEERFAISCLLAGRPCMPASFRQLLRQPSK